MNLHYKIPLNSIKNNLGSICVCSYLFTFWIDSRRDISLAVLAASSIATYVFCQYELMPQETIKTFYRNPFVLIIFFLVLSVASAFLGYNWDASLSRSVSFIPALSLYIIIRSYFTRIIHFTALCFTLSTISIAISGSVFLSVYGLPDAGTRAWVEATGIPILAVPNDIALLAVISPFSLVQIHRKSVGYCSTVAYCGLALSVGAAIILQSRIAFAAHVFAALGTITILRSTRMRYAISAIVLSSIFFDGLLGFGLLHKFMNLWNPRIQLWLSAFNMFLDAPLFGHGPHTFGILWQSYHSTATYWNAFPIPTEFTPWPHNLYLEILCERGLLGIFAFSLINAHGLISAWQLSKQRESETNTMACGVLASFLTFLFSAFFELTFLRLWVVVMWFVLLASVDSLRTMAPSTSLRS